MKNRGRFWRLCSLVTALLLVCLVLPVGNTFAEPILVNAQFQAKWQRTDKPVQDGTANPSRSWLWGPEGFNQSGVTNGLLVIELTSGRLATGDTASLARKPADIPVAGDATNNKGPTYASLASAR